MARNNHTERSKRQSRSRKKTDTAKPRNQAHEQDSRARVKDPDAGMDLTGWYAEPYTPAEEPEGGAATEPNPWELPPETPGSDARGFDEAVTPAPHHAPQPTPHMLPDDEAGLSGAKADDALEGAPDGWASTAAPGRARRDDTAFDDAARRHFEPADPETLEERLARLREKTARAAASGTLSTRSAPERAARLRRPGAFGEERLDDMVQKLRPQVPVDDLRAHNAAVPPPRRASRPLIAIGLLMSVGVGAFAAYHTMWRGDLWQSDGAGVTPPVVAAPNTPVKIAPLAEQKGEIKATALPGHTPLPRHTQRAAAPASPASPAKDQARIGQIPAPPAAADNPVTQAQADTQTPPAQPKPAATPQLAQAASATPAEPATPQEAPPVPERPAETPVLPASRTSPQTQAAAPNAPGQDASRQSPANPRDTRTPQHYMIEPAGTAPGLGRAPVTEPSSAPADASRPARLAAIAPDAPTSTRSSAPASSPASTAAQTPKPGADSALIAQGDKHMRDGHISTARLLYEHAARQGDITAAVKLAETYDPLVMEKLEVYGLKPQPETARSWYQRAAERGDALARQRLQALAAAGLLKN